MDPEVKALFEALNKTLESYKPTRRSMFMEFLKTTAIFIVSTAFFAGILIQRVNSTFDEIDQKFSTTEEHENSRAITTDQNLLIISKEIKMDPEILTPTRDE